MAGFGGDRLEQQRRSLSGVKVLQEAVDTRLAEASELLAEVKELANGGIWVVVRALHRGCWAQDVAQQGRVADFLISHELNQESVLCGETCSLKFLNREAGEAVVEEV